MKKLVLLFVSLLSLNVFAISYIVDYKVTGPEASWSGEFSVPSQTTQLKYSSQMASLGMMQTITAIIPETEDVSFWTIGYTFNETTGVVKWDSFNFEQEFSLVSIPLATDIIDGITWENILGKSYSITDFVFGTPATPTCTLESGTITFNEHLVPEPTTICILALGGIVYRFKNAG